MTKENLKPRTTQLLINKLYQLNSVSMTIIYFRFLGNCRVPLASTAGVISIGRGFYYIPLVFFVWRSIPLKSLV